MKSVDCIGESIWAEELCCRTLPSVEVMISSALFPPRWPWWVEVWWSRCCPGCHQAPQHALGLELDEVTANSGVGINIGWRGGSWRPWRRDLRKDEDWKWVMLNTYLMNHTSHLNYCLFLWFQYGDIRVTNIIMVWNEYTPQLRIIAHSYNLIEHWAIFLFNIKLHSTRK